MTTVPTLAQDTGRATPRDAEARPRPKPRKRKTQAAFYWMVVPAAVLFFVLHTIPVIQGVFYSFTDYAGYGEWEWVGFKNYANLFRDDRVIDSYLFTVKFAVVATVLVNVVALAIAVGLNGRIRFRNALRGVFFIPNVLTILIIGFVFQYLFANWLPLIGEKTGINALSTNLLANEDLAWVGIVTVAVWQAAAFAIILYLAGLQTVPTDLYEAATIDGAGPWLQFWRITFPLIAPFFAINLVLSMKGFLQVFDLIVAMTDGGPGTSTESVSLVIYKGGFQGGEFAYQTANAVIFFIFLAVMAMIQLRILRRREVAL